MAGFQDTQAGFEASEQRATSEFAQSLKLQRDTLMQSIRGFEAQDARDSENMRFLLRKQQVAVEEGNRTALQQAFGLQEQISSRIESTRLQRQQLVTNVQTLNAQMASETARFNSQQQMQADQINESRRQANLDQRRGVARDIAEFSANPGDVGKMASYLRSGGATGITQAMAAGETAITDESLLPLELLLGTRNELNGGPNNFDPTLVDAPEVAIPEFAEMADAPGIDALFDAVEFDESGILSEGELPPAPDGALGPYYDQYLPPDGNGGVITKPAGSGPPTIAELDALPRGGTIESDGTVYTNRGTENQALSSLPLGEYKRVPDFVKQGVDRPPTISELDAVGVGGTVRTPAGDTFTNRGADDQALSRLTPKEYDRVPDFVTQKLGLAEGGVGVFNKPSKLNVAEKGPEMVIGVPLGDEQRKRGGERNVSGIGAGIGSFAASGEASSEFQRRQAQQPKFDLNARPVVDSGPSRVGRSSAGRERSAEVGRGRPMENRLAAMQGEQRGQPTTSQGMATRLARMRPSGGARVDGDGTPREASAGGDVGVERRRQRMERFARMSLEQQARVREALVQRGQRGRSGGRRQDGRPRSASGEAQRDLGRVFERPEVRDVFARLDPQVRQSLTRALAQSGGGSSRQSGRGRGLRQGVAGRRQRLGFEEGGVGLFSRPTAVNVAEAGPEAIVRVPVDEARQYQEQVYRDALRKSGFESAPTPVGLSAPGTSRFLQDLGAGVAGTRGFSRDAYFEELERARPTAVRAGVSRRTT